MSFDLAVFDPAFAPADRGAFLDWYQRQTEWEEDHEYDDPMVATPGLQAWYRELIAAFPSMNDPTLDADRIDAPECTDYSIGKTMIYAAFSFDVAEKARAQVFELARKYRLGFFDIGGEGAAIWGPAGSLEYVIVSKDG